jgi:cadmium resistance protein CadD (predicted permease)
MVQKVLTSILVFVSTNIDDLFILTLFYGSGKYRSAQIMGGQYLGIFTLVVISFIGSLVGNFIDQRYIGFLGLFPIYLAIKQIVELLKNETSDESELAGKNLGVLAIAGVTIANGGDNIGVYAPLLTTLPTPAKLQFLIIFLFMVFIWCLSAKYLAHRPLIAKSLHRYGHVIMPIVLLLLGIFIMYESKSLSLFQ